MQLLRTASDDVTDDGGVRSSRVQVVSRRGAAGDQVDRRWTLLSSVIRDVASWWRWWHVSRTVSCHDVVLVSTRADAILRLLTIAILCLTMQWPVLGLRRCRPVSLSSHIVPPGCVTGRRATTVVRRRQPWHQLLAKVCDAALGCHHARYLSSHRRLSTVT